MHGSELKLAFTCVIQLYLSLKFYEILGVFVRFSVQILGDIAKN